ncbi:hypothetical protein [Sphingosinicella terrae]|uniref:hypothetical protein n=1 Tax=Sphingosinicella terrae TaxID=2172047 RepID=UPI0013B476CC|nr:hypothetical protein [Sphingosinicella terrae]
MKRLIGLGLAGMAALLASCGSEQETSRAERPAVRPPEPACAQARTTLRTDYRDSGLLFEETGEALISRQRWMRMSEGARDALIQPLAVVAACSADTPQREVQVTVRDEAGMVLETRHVRPSTDFRTR